MKYALTGFILFSLLAFALPVWADAVDDGLPPTVNEQVRLQTREMIRVGVPAEEAVAMTRRMVQQHFTDAALLQAQRQVIAACEDGLPHEPLFNKLQEGLAKQVPPENVVKAMQTVRERYQSSYRFARQITADKDRQKALGEAQAQGLAAGLQTRDMARIQEQVQERIRLQTCDDCPQLALESALAARDMARLGVASPNVAEVVGQALENGYDSPGMHRMRHQFQERAQYEDPQGLAHRYAQAFRHGQDPAADNTVGSRGATGGGIGGGGNGGGGNGGGGSGGGGRR